ncbi:MAG: hypothetical protein CM15mV64_500 [uncultured marine virus]|nr:MAG: hypothetical protein CM15mV64_500 [uncultured marine virus]|tara:strand:+ start:958 stop:1338 length:381 start_codon:yes stop_codon:yes gene_type:complete
MQKAIKKEDWEYYWEHSKKFIEPALKHQDSYTIDDIEDKIRHGFFHLWPGKESAFVTEIVRLPQITIMNLMFCGGNYKELEQMLESIEKFAKAIGVKRLYGGGRKGWVRKIKHLGFQEESLIVKEL